MRQGLESRLAVLAGVVGLLGSSLVVATPSGSKAAGTREAATAGARHAEQRVRGPRQFEVVQLNLCLHHRNIRSCYDRPGSGGPQTPKAKRDEALRVIRHRRPHVVTLNEVSAADLRRIGSRSGYERRFTATERGKRRCSNGRGRFGIGLLARRFDGPPVDRWRYGDGRWGMCARTASGVLVCTSHLRPGSPSAQCRKLRRKLARRSGPVVFGGDVNRRGDRPRCSPRGFWARRDFMTDQIPGVQHVYAATQGYRPIGEHGRARHMRSTDHSAFVVRMRRR